MFMYALFMLTISTCMQSMEEQLPYLSLKRLSYVLGYHRAKKLGDSISLELPNEKLNDGTSSLAFINKIRALFPLETESYITSFLDDETLLKESYTRSFTFYKQHSKHKHEVYSLAFDNQTGYLYAGSQDGLIRRWSTKNNKRLKSLPGHNERVLALCLDPSGKTLCSKGIDIFGDIECQTIKLWDLATKQLKYCFPFPVNSDIHIISLAANADHLFIGDAKGGVHAISLFPDPSHAFLKYVYSRPTLYNKKRIRVLTFEPSMSHLLIGYDNNIASHALLEKGNEHVFSCNDDETYSYIPTEEQLTAFAIDPATGYHILTMTAFETIRFYNPLSRTVIHSLSGHTKMIWGLAFGNQKLYSGSHDKTIKVWRPKVTIQQARDHCGIWEWLVLKTLEQERKDSLKLLFSTETPIVDTQDHY